jgi:argininosuccinate lyase
MDTVSDRDFALEILFNISTCMMHISRISEELILWSSYEFQFVRMSDEYATTSSIMPQKKNPDAAELVRGKTGRIFGATVSLLTTLKGLTLTYSKDMQEDKEPVFDASKNTKICVEAMSGMIKDLKANPENMLKMAKKGFSTATDIADWLVKNLNMPFRNAHHVTGQIVKLAEDKNLDLNQLSLIEMQKIEPKINDSIFDVLSVENSALSRQSKGGTSKIRVLEEIENAKKYLGN